MKSRIAVIAALAIFTVHFAASTEPTKKFNTEEKLIHFATTNLRTALHSSNPGLIESAMRITSLMKMRYPNADVSELVSTINDIRTSHPSGTTRYKAYIALSICENPEWYSNDHNIVSANEESFFRAASERLQEQLLSDNTQ
ncbi:MAG: hypothetical protein WCW40_03525 [Bacteroidota bacterium]